MKAWGNCEARTSIDCQRPVDDCEMPQQTMNRDGMRTQAGSWSLEMPNGTADRTQSGGAVGGEWRWEWLYDGGMKAL